MPTVFEQIFGNGQGGAQGLLGNPAFMVGSGLLSNQSNPWGGAIQGLAAAQGYKLSESRMKKDEEKEARQAELQAMQMKAMQDAQARQQYTQSLLAAGSSQNPALLQDPAFQSQLRMKAAAYGDPAMLQAGGLLQAPQEPTKPTSAMQNLAAMGLQPGTPEYESMMRDYMVKPRSTVNVNTGAALPYKLPADHMLVDPSDPSKGVMDNAHVHPCVACIHNTNRSLALKDVQANKALFPQHPVVPTFLWPWFDNLLVLKQCRVYDCPLMLYRTGCP